MLWLLLVAFLMFLAVVRGWNWKKVLVVFLIALAIRFLVGAIGVLMFLVPSFTWLVPLILLGMIVFGPKKVG